MDELVNALLAIDKVLTVPQRDLDCGPDLGRLKHPTPSDQSMCGKYNIFNRCTNRNQLDILMKAVANVRKGQTGMPYKGEHQTLTKHVYEIPRLS